MTHVGDKHWRHMTAADLDGVVRVARASFPDHFEDRACFAERFELYHRGCFTLDLGGERVDGYLIAYPWLLGSAPPLNSLIRVLPEQADVIYLHDLALDPAVRGRGYTRAIVERLCDQAAADGWPAVALVAVNRASTFWAGLGFEDVHWSGMSEKLASYGEDAAYMVRRLTR